jgi:hypothetical protein
MAAQAALEVLAPASFRLEIDERAKPHDFASRRQRRHPP